MWTFEQDRAPLTQLKPLNCCGRLNFQKCKHETATELHKQFKTSEGEDREDKTLLQGVDVKILLVPDDPEPQGGRGVSLRTLPWDFLKTWFYQKNMHRKLRLFILLGNSVL